MDYRREIDRLRLKREITCDELGWLLELSDEHADYLFQTARQVCDENYGKKIYIRALVEYTNYCKNNCYYCGIRGGHTALARYRMTDEKILNSIQIAYEEGARTFVLQGGENPMDKDKLICELVKKIRDAYPDCAITLSIGEKSKESYQAYFDAGADRYLLRHETANRDHYGQLHPPAMIQEHRIKCLFDLLDIGYQVGCGMMIGSPGQTVECLYEDLLFISELCPHMIGIGPFIPHESTPFASEECGSAEQTLRMLAIIRIMNPKVLLPATTALATADNRGYEKGILAGANVIMPNFTPKEIKKRYTLYDNKYGIEDDGVDSMESIRKRVADIGYEVVVDRGDSLV